MIIYIFMMNTMAKIYVMLKTKSSFKKLPQTPKVNVHIYPSPFKNESRILRVTKTLFDANVFDKIYIVATLEPGLPKTEALDEKREVVRICRKLGNNKEGVFWKTIKTLEWSWRIIWYLRKQSIDCINCHSLPVLPLCVFLKIIHGSKLIYDTHELETETDGLKGIRKGISKLVEWLLIGFANETVTVSDSIAEWYQRRYKIKKVSVVKNVPYSQEVSPYKTKLLRDAFKIRDNHLLFLYQGEISRKRGIDLLLNVFSRVSHEKHIVFLGFGEMVDIVKDYAIRFPNIHYHPAAEPDNLFQYTCSADVGVHLIKNTCLNHYYCLPNKIWEYLNASIPIIVSDLFEMGKVVDYFKCGWKCQGNENDVIALIEQITLDLVSEKRNYANASRNFIGWHLEEPTLLSIYERLGFEINYQYGKKIWDENTNNNRRSTTVYKSGYNLKVIG
jgi:glycosyltransferase involved in cell wall biosynthesis